MVSLVSRHYEPSSIIMRSGVDGGLTDFEIYGYYANILSVYNCVKCCIIKGKRF